jgi:hypothetical protein
MAKSRIHYTECWRAHHDCAVNRLAAVAKVEEGLREAAGVSDSLRMERGYLWAADLIAAALKGGTDG